jgi:hypothetical protein
MSNKITHATRLTVLKHLAAGKPADLVAKIMKLSHYEIIDIGAEHGYPDVAKMAEGVATITREIENGERDELASRPLAGPETITPRPAPTTHRPASATSPAPRPAAATAAAPATASPSPQVLTQPDELRAVINTGKQSSSKRVQALTNRIIDDLARLKDAIHAEQAKAEEARRKADERAAAARARAAERAALEKKKSDLEAELRAVKAKLRGRTGGAGPMNGPTRPKASAAPASTPTSPMGAPTPAKKIRAWARQAGFDVPVTGRVPQKVREAYAAAHRADQAA